MSADTAPISPARFAGALKGLSVSMLHLKVLEIRNSIAHLQYSNDQLKPFAQGTATATDSSTRTTGIATSREADQEPDQDCIDAIRENEHVIDRMAERIALIRAEVEERGVSWTEFQSKEEVEGTAEPGVDMPSTRATTGNDTAIATNGQSDNTLSPSPWTDGTFQTGVIRNGQVHMDGQGARPSGGRLSDEELSKAMEERMRELEDDGDAGSATDDGSRGLHL